MNATQRLAEFVAATQPETIGAEAREQAMRAFLDTLGVMLAGCREAGPAIVAEMVRDQGGAEEATVVGAGFRATAGQAVLVNGTAAHALDYDDVTINMRGHPSVPLVPAVLALGEKLGSSGRDVLDAYVLGFEVECKLGRAIGDPHYALGWHATSTFGTVGAAVACARLLKLNTDRTQNALGIAASLASGLQANFGTMTKPLHAGWAAHNGLLAAELAARGFDADAEALEGPSGFLRAMSGGAEIDAEAAVRGLGEPWEVLNPGIGVKLYPCCYATHRAIDAALEIREFLLEKYPSAKCNGKTIFDIDTRVSPGTLTPLLGGRPTTGLEAKFSLEYCVAAAIADGEVTLRHFSEDSLVRDDLAELMMRVEVTEEGEALAFPIAGRAHIQLDFVPPTGPLVITDSTVIEVPRGDPKNPLTWDELCGKFRDCAGAVLPPERVEALIGLCERLDALPGVSELMEPITRTEA